MGKQRHYPNPPITEAIIDLRVELPETVKVADLEKAHAGEESAYPIKKNRILAIGQIQVGEQVAAAARSKHIGFLFISMDGKQLFQARLDGFSMNRLAPYENWDVFCAEARRLWDRYRSVAKPKKLLRLAVRYINRLDLPLPVPDLKDYLRTVPEISPDLPQNLEGYFLHLRIPMGDIKSTLLVNQTIIEASGPNIVSVVLDNDIYRDDDVPQNDDAVWSFFEELRARKNEVFESSITDRARELFK